MVASFVIPWINIPYSSERPTFEFIAQTTTTLEGVVIYAEQMPSRYDPLLIAILSVYLLGFCYLGFRFLVQLVNIRMFLQRKDVRFKAYHNAWLVDNLGLMPTFSFLDYIFHHFNQKESAFERERILRHELAHIQQGHTYDVLFVEVLRIIFWFIPTIHLYAKALEEVHEYLADEAAILGTDPRAYIQLLAKTALHNLSFGLVRQFSKSQTLKRIHMIESGNKPRRFWPMLGIIPLTALLVVIFSCERAEDFSEIAELTAKEGLSPKEMQDASQTLSIRYSIAEGEDKDYMIEKENSIIARVGTSIFEFSELNSAEDKEKAYDFIKKFQEKAYQAEIPKAAPSNPGSNLPRSPSTLSNGMEVWDTFALEVQPEPVGGMSEFYRYINENISYPQSAKNMGIEGKVFLMFIINTDGSLSDVEVIKGIHPDCDQMAIDVVRNAPKWKAGKQSDTPVNVRMRLPITFKL
jgi:TonB family protein